MTDNPYSRKIFVLIIVYRWISLIPVFFFMVQGYQDSSNNPLSWAILGAVLVANLILTGLNQPLNQLLLHRPYILLGDLLFSAGILALSGGVMSPYFLYSLSPLMAGAFFFQIKGGLVTTGVYTPLYLAAVINFDRNSQFYNEFFITEFMWIWLIPIVFGYLSILLSRLRYAHDDLVTARDNLESQNAELATTHRQLQTIYDLAVMLQAAPDVSSVQNQVLIATTQAYEFSRALLGLYRPGLNTISTWKSHKKEARANQDSKSALFEMQLLSTMPTISLDSDKNIVSEALNSGEYFWVTDHDMYEVSNDLGEWLGKDHGLILPLIFHEQPVGVLFAVKENSGIDISNEQITLLKILANQAATSLGTTMLCVERAKDLAVEQERNRIARDIHDTVAQSLFGIIYSLDAIIQMLSEQPEAVENELIQLQVLASQTRDQIRQSIFDLWPTSLTIDAFQSDLSTYVKRCFSINPMRIEYDISGIFDDLSPAIRRNLYRITQEALSNILHHAGVDQAQVCLDIGSEWVTLDVKDEGRGFNPDEALAREHDREHFGLHGIQERTTMLGGQCEIISQPGEGTHICIRIPVNGH